MVLASIPSAGHCNSMGTALSMNSLAEALGMSLPGCGTIPAPYAERAKMAYQTGRRIVEMVREDLTPSKVLTREAFENAIVVNSAIGGSTNCPPHIIAIARHAGVELDIRDWERWATRFTCWPTYSLPESFLRGLSSRWWGGAIFGELMQAGKIRCGALTVTGATMGENYKDARSLDTNVIRTYDNPLKQNAGFLVVSGNLFTSALVKTSVISDEFRRRYLRTPATKSFVARAIVFDGPEDYRKRIEDPSLPIDEHSILVVRGAGPVGYPGSAEVVNMTPPGRLIRQGIRMLPCMGDGRQSGTSDSPSILTSLRNRRLAATWRSSKPEIRSKSTWRIGAWTFCSPRRKSQPAQRPRPAEITHHSPWEEFYRSNVGQLEAGACLEFAVKYHDVRKVVPRHSH